MSQMEFSAWEIRSLSFDALHSKCQTVGELNLKSHRDSDRRRATYVGSDRQR